MLSSPPYAFSFTFLQFRPSPSSLSSSSSSYSIQSTQSACLSSLRSPPSLNKSTLCTFSRSSSLARSSSKFISSHLHIAPSFNSSLTHPTSVLSYFSFVFPNKLVLLLPSIILSSSFRHFASFLSSSTSSLSSCHLLTPLSSMSVFLSSRSQ